MTEEDQARMDAFFNAVHFDETGDWRKSAEAAADPDDEPDEESEPESGSKIQSNPAQV